MHETLRIKWINWRSFWQENKEEMVDEYSIDTSRGNGCQI